MARRYSRDNKGRFAPAGTGATARGGRLRTASGNKRATQVKSGSKRATPSGAIRKTDVVAARTQNAISRNIERRNKAGVNPPTAAKENQATRVARAERRIAGQKRNAKPNAVESKPQVSSARQAATDRLKVKTQTRRAMRADRASVVTPGQRSRLETRKGTTMRAQRVSNTIPKSAARTKGNEPAQVAKRANRKAISAERQLARNLELRRRGQLVNSKSDVKTLKSSITLKKAKNYLATGKLPGKDNSIAAQRSMKQAKERLATKNAARQAAKSSTQKERWAARSERLKNAAAKNEAKAKNMFNAANTAGNTAFNTQPGRIAGRAKMNAQTERSFQLQEKAAQQRSRAANLERMATRSKGDAAKGRTQKAEAIKASHKGLKKGDKIEGTLYGEREVVKVNAKSVTVKGGVKNFTIPWEFIKPKR